MDKIAAAFVKAQKEFAPALKTSTNPAFRSKYVSLDGCIEAVIDALNSNGIALLQPTHDCESGVTVETLFLHESGQTMSGGKLHVPASKQDPQGYGSALTYARRYSLMAACGIAPEDDDGNAASNQQHKTKPAATQQPKPATLTLTQCGELTDLINATGTDFPSFMAWISKGAGYECKSLRDAPESAYQPAKKALEAKQKEPA